MPLALRTLVRARRLQAAAVPTRNHAQALLHFGHSSSATQSAFYAPACRQALNHHSASALLDPRSQYGKLPFSRANSQACLHHVKVSMSHHHTYASEAISLNTVSVQGTPQAPHIRARCKGQKKSESAAAELLHQKVCLLELEQVSLCDATILSKSIAFKSTSFQNLAAFLQLLKKLLGSGEKACRALAMNPGFLRCPSEIFQQTLKLFDDFGIREEIVRKLCTTHRGLTLKVESLHKRLSLLEEIGLTVEAINGLIFVRPQILCCPDSSILHPLDFLKSLGMSGKEIMHSWCMHPDLLLLSVDTVRKKLDFFQQLGFSVNEFRRFICAGLLRLSIKRVQEKIKILKDQGFSDSDVRVLISRFPSILRLMDKSLKSKLDFLLCEQKYDLTDIVKCPACLGYSLQGRLIPRFKALREKGLSKVYALSTILKCNDQRFQTLGRRGKMCWYCEHIAGMPACNLLWKSRAGYTASNLQL